MAGGLRPGGCEAWGKQPWGGGWQTDDPPWEPPSPFQHHTAHTDPLAGLGADTHRAPLLRCAPALAPALGGACVTLPHLTGEHSEAQKRPVAGPRPGTEQWAESTLDPPASRRQPGPCSPHRSLGAEGSEEGAGRELSPRGSETPKKGDSFLPCPGRGACVSLGPRLAWRAASGRRAGGGCAEPSGAGRGACRGNQRPGATDIYSCPLLRCRREGVALRWERKSVSSPLPLWFPGEWTGPGPGPGPSWLQSCGAGLGEELCVLSWGFPPGLPARGRSLLNMACMCTRVCLCVQTCAHTLLSGVRLGSHGPAEARGQ